MTAQFPSQPMIETAETRTVHDPFLGKDVQVSDKLTDRLRGRYAMGPHLPNGKPEFGWRQFQAPPIQHEAAAVIEHLSISNASLKARIQELEAELAGCRACREKIDCISRGDWNYTGSGLLGPSCKD